METISAPVVDPAESAADPTAGSASAPPPPRTRVRPAIEAATAALRGADPRLLVVFVSPAHDLQALLAGIRGVAPDTPLIGCSTAGEIATDGPSDASVVVTAIGGSGFSVATKRRTQRLERPAPGRSARRDLRRERTCG